MKEHITPHECALVTIDFRRELKQFFIVFCGLKVFLLFLNRIRIGVFLPLEHLGRVNLRNVLVFWFLSLHLDHIQEAPRLRIHDDCDDHDCKVKNGPQARTLDHVLNVKLYASLSTHISVLVNMQIRGTGAQNKLRALITNLYSRVLIWHQNAIKKI